MRRRFACLFIVLLLIVSIIGVVSAAPATLVVRAGAVNDGHVAAWSGQTYTALRNRAGQAAVKSTYANYAGLHAISVSNRYDELYRSVVLFNTSALPDDCTVTSVKFGVRGVSKSNGLGSFAYGITGFRPTKTDGTFVMGDYQRFYNDRWADSDIPYANLVTTGWNNWTGNSRFISNISKTGWTGVMVRDKPDIDNNSALITWKSGATSRFSFQDVGSGTAPFLEITYTTSGGSPVALFTSNVSGGTAPLAVKFTDQSTGTGPLSYAWDFDNNGIIDSTDQSPVFTYATAGSYTAKLTVSNGAGTNSVTHIITVTAAPIPPTAIFITNVTGGTAPLAVKFTDQSTGTGPLSYTWDFDNNGVIDSTVQSPVFIYTTAGSYTVNLTVSNGAGTNSVTQIITVTAAPVPPTAAFSTNVTGGTAPLSVKFTDQSTGTDPLSYAWDFDNNGVIDSTVQSPVFTYTTAGTYTANLTVSNGAGTNSVTHTITVTAAPVPPTAAFSTNVTGGPAPLAVKFTDQSTGTAPLSYAWDFDNNGVIDSTDQSPVFTYATAGTYTANLTVSNGAGTNSVTHTITVTAAPVPPTAIFSTNVTGGTAPLAVKFTDQSTGTGPLSYAWDFDNNGVIDSTDQSPVFTYTTAGTYTANLTVSNGAGTNSVTHTITVTAATTPPTAVFSTNVTGGPAPLAVKFTDQSTGTAPLSYAWDFDNNGVIDSTDQSPVFTYATAGSYTANLTVSNGAGTNSVTHIITVTAATTPPTAVFSTNVTGGTAPLAVKFTDQSTGTAPLSYAWDFDNNGVIDSLVQSPEFTYATAGTYTANLTISNSAGTNSVTHTITVTAAPIPPTAIFSTNVTGGTAPLAVKFTDQSTGTGPLSYSWDFENNGVIDSTDQSPVFTYATAGTYTANLTISNSAGSNSVTHTITVTSAPVVPKTLIIRAGAANDGHVAAWSGPAYTPLRNRAGQAADASTYANYAGLHATTASNQYDELYRAVVLFNTSGLPDDCTVTAVKFGVRGDSKSNGLGSFSYGITGFSPTKTDGTFVMGDYQRFYNDRWADSDIPYANLVTTGWNNWTGNSRFMSNISKTGWTGVMVRDKPDIDNNSALITWKSGATSRFAFQEIGDSVAPFLEITYSAFPAAGSPAAAFSSNVTAGVMPLPVQFTDSSTGTAPLSYSWDFDNNGVTDSTVQNPVFTYMTAGTYTVKLTVSNGAGTNSVTHTITVTAAPVPPTAVFSTNVTVGTAPLAVKFTDASTGTGPLSYAWDFDNNGVIDSTVQNPVFTYSTVGTYTANLTVSNSVGSNFVTRTITVTEVIPIVPVAAFTANVTSGNAPLAVRFTDQSTGTLPLTYTWDFGDDGVSSAMNPTHTFDSPGTYTVSLTVQNAAGFDSETKTGYITVSPSGSSTAGIALTFDDNSVDEWFEARSIFQQYNAHATFFISNFNSLNQDQITKLKTLQDDGHEIAFHGYNHEDVVSYLQSHSLSDYMNNEIIQGINLMKSEGFNPVDFAFPYGSDDPEANQAMEPYFLHMRDTYYDWDNTIYYEYGSNTPYIAGIGIDDNTYGNSLSDIYEGISTAKQNNRIIIFYGHTLVSGSPGQYETSYTRLQNILQYASANGMKTYTIAEIH